MALKVKRTDLYSHNVPSVTTYDQAHYPGLFTGQTNHDGTVFNIDPSLFDNSENPSAPINVSRPPVGDKMTALLPSNLSWRPRIIRWNVLWWGQSNHPNIGINDRAAADIARQTKHSFENGEDVFLVDWYTINSAGQSCDDTVADIVAANLQPGQKFVFAINSHYVTKYNPTNPQQALIDGINHILDKYASQASYERYNGPLAAYAGRPPIFFWDIDGALSSAGMTVDWNAIRAGVSGNSHGNPILVRYQSGGFTKAQSDGSFSWLDNNADNASDPSGAVGYMQNSFLPAAKSHQNLICVPSVWPRFNGTLTGGTGAVKSGTNSWSLGKYIDENGGLTWLKCWDIISTWLKAGNRADYLMLVTADDVQEGSALLMGIRTDVRISAALSGTTLTYQLTAGDEYTVKQYNLWGTLDGTNFTLLDSRTPNQTKSFDLNTLPGLDADGQYTLHVQAQSKAFLECHMAAQTFANVNLKMPVVGPPPPTGTLKALMTLSINNGVAPLSLTADASGSNGPNPITQYSFDFGDGTVVTGAAASAQHTYTDAGTYNCKVTVTDSASGTASATASVNVTPPTQTGGGGGGGTQANAPVAVLNSDVTQGSTPFIVNFDGTNSYIITGNITQYVFDFGDGTPIQAGLGMTAQHTYIKQGTFLATLTVYADNGLYGTSTQQIVSATPPVVAPPANSQLPPPPPAPPTVPTDTSNPSIPATPLPTTPPDPRRVLCQRFKDKYKK